jgi:hypothetical protein
VRYQQGGRIEASNEAVLALDHPRIGLRIFPLYCQAIKMQLESEISKAIIALWSSGMSRCPAPRPLGGAPEIQEGRDFPVCSICQDNANVGLLQGQKQPKQYPGPFA